MNTEKIAHHIIDIVDKHIDGGTEEGTYTVDYYKAIQGVKDYLDQLDACPHTDCQRNHDHCTDCNNGDLYQSPDKEVSDG